MLNRILILFAHPRLERSVNNTLLLSNIPVIPEITLHDLYEVYPDFNIDIEREKQLLKEHDVIVWHHPFYWYSSPPLLKQWIDLVLEFGWAYGPGGNELEGKVIFNCVTIGGPRTAYNRDGYNRFTVRELLAPFIQTACLCKMNYLPPFAVHGTHRLKREGLESVAEQYNMLLGMLVRGQVSADEVCKFTYLNDWLLNIKDKIPAP
jgi:glutathione-regulated potassium-efflux system ancillary protein KefG